MGSPFAGPMKSPLKLGKEGPILVVYDGKKPLREGQGFHREGWPQLFIADWSISSIPPGIIPWRGLKVKPTTKYSGGATGCCEKATYPPEGTSVGRPGLQ